MTPRKQAANSLGRRLVKKMIDLDLTFTELANKVGRPRESVSRAVHHGTHPQVLRDVRKALDV